MIEAELKARVHTPEAVLKRLDERATGRAEVYQDTYYDDTAGGLDARDEELRVRTVHGAEESRTLLTFKGARADAASGSKPEHETRVSDAGAVHAMLRGLGYVPVIAFEKRCRNYDFEAYGRRMLATLVRVPELDGTFLEVETIVDEADMHAALEDVRTVLADLGIDGDDLTTELYTDAVRTRRGR
ncbi:class IV adenylate cyclase [Streptomyces sp. SDr-06]|uniref:class IV adenylate cyclase n=1 Tax=Streptomyces sp. SDr-06 TaxID=2267702 RepID=UPI000DE8EC45|nr:class IV adenylate cyclase [Streptomyces sp. SDr-06]RCH67490.1 class IV adenylate cyclase [Streptomyces sp. SDr-06]